MMIAATRAPEDAVGASPTEPGPTGPSTTEPPEAEQPKGIELTPKAIEMAKKALKRRGTPESGLRLGVRGGGCSGVSYAIEFADKVRKKDNVFDFDGLKVVIDPKSLIYLRGSVLDYEFKLMSHGFKFVNPNESGSCGCGESFTV
ncbi:MAG: iron-sulfur cluster assembly accessory protein [Myxococcota bacterium]